MTTRFGEQPMRPWNGKWTPLRLDTVHDVGVEVQDFVAHYREQKRALDTGDVAVDGFGYMERRLKAMLRSAQLRLDIITFFYDANKKDPRCERLKTAVRRLRTLLLDEGVPDEQFAPEVAFGPHSFDADDAASAGGEGKQKHRKNSRDGLSDTFVRESEAKPEESANARARQEEAVRLRTQSKDMEITMLHEHVEELTGKLTGLEQDNLKLERAMLEMCEGRERVKGIVEEQVYTIALMSKVSGLLHFELRRILFRTVARGILFWCTSVVMILHTVLTGGSHVFNAYMFFRHQLEGSIGMWTMLVIDLIALSLGFGIAHEWILLAEQDISHGSIHWCIESVLMQRDDAVEAARVAAQRQAEYVLQAAHIDLAAYQRTTQKRREEAAALANSTVGSHPPLSPVVRTPRGPSFIRTDIPD
ncbi:hypothetical protein DIPPA_13606 [Diplonema papillatum]|nr:hypothetical protein DIPPA_13606 [Diplonema papillatum]